MKQKQKSKPRPPERIPEFQSYEEEADFWDTFSPEDFPDEFEEVEVSFGKPLEIVHVKNWHETLVDTLTKLPEGERQVLSLSMLGLYPDEIARVTGWSTTDCQTTLRAAKRKIRGLARRKGG